MKGLHLAVDDFSIRFVGYQPTAVGSASKLASLERVCSGFGVEVEEPAVDGFGIGVGGDDPLAVTAFGAHHFTPPATVA